MDLDHYKNIGNIPSKLDNEIFKPLDNFFNTKEWYYVSNFGRLYSIKVKRYLKLTPKSDGYIRHPLVLNTKVKKSLHVGELVMITFKGLRPKNMQIDHIDRNKANNNLYNLRYVTASENCLNRTKSEISHQNKNILMINLNTKEEIIFISITQAEKETKISQKIIRKHCRNNTLISDLLFKFYHKSIKDEEWIDIKYNNQNISCSNKGRIKRSNRSITIGSLTTNGYRGITINKKTFLVHRIICETFKEKHPEDKPFVNHIDEDKLNNHIDNLEWCSNIDNLRHSHSKTILQYNLNNEFIKEFRDSLHAEELTGVKNINIRQVCNNERKTAGGFIWKFKKNYTKEYDHGKTVIRLDKTGKFLEKYKSINDAIRKTKITHVGDVCVNKRKTAGGFKWIYEDDYEYTEIIFNE